MAEPMPYTQLWTNTNSRKSVTWSAVPVTPAFIFLDASSHLYKRVCPSVGPSVGPSVRPSVGPSVRDAFVKIAENGLMQDEDASYVVYTALFFSFWDWPKQSRIHDSISPVRLGRGSNAQKSTKKKVLTDRRTDRRTDRPTDTPSYRVAWTRLKT